MAKSLCIVFQCIEPRMPPGGLGDGDVLAFTPSAMDMCEELGIRFLTTDEFIDFSAYTARSYVLADEIALACAQMDEQLDTRLAELLPHSQDAYGLWMVLAHFDYLHELGSALAARYESIRYVGAPPFRPLREELAVDQAEGLLDFGDDIKLAASVFAEFMTPTVQELGTGRDHGRNARSLWSRMRPVLGRIKRRLLGQSLDASRPTSDKTSCTALVNVHGYGLELMAREMPALRLLTMDQALRESGPALVGCVSACAQTGRPLRRILRERLPQLAEVLGIFFGAHRTRTLGALPGQVRQAAAALDVSRPKFLCFCNGIHGQQPYALAHEANRRDIPVCVLQHGGMQLHRMPACFSQEAPQGLAVDWLYQGRLDAEQYPHANPIRIGNIPAWSMHALKPDLQNIALFLHGSCAYFGYRSMPCSDSVGFANQKDIVKIFADGHIPLHIKAHPYHSEQNQRYFRSLAKRIGKGFATVLPPCRAETILHRYGLLVIENVASLTSVLALGLDVPVILHDPVDVLIRPDIREALLKRVYFSQTSEQLGQYVALFAAGELPAKGVAQAREDFMWSTDGPDPVKRLTVLFQEYCDGGAYGRQREGA